MVFTVLAFIGQFAVFAFVACAVVVLLTLCFPRRWFAFTVGIFLATVTVMLFIVDAVIYQQYHYHLAGLVWNILMSGVFTQVIVLSSMEWISAGFIALALLLLECGLAFWIWRRVQRGEPKGHGRFVAIGLAASLFLSYTLYLAAGLATTTPGKHSIAARSNDHLIIMEAQIVPYYMNVFGHIVPGERSFQKLVNMNDGFLVQGQKVNKPLDYPLHPLTFKTPKKLYNIVIIGIDTWRSDMMNKTVSPIIAKFAKTAWTFTDNYSGGNCTRPGIFSLFYSIPPNYWTAMLDQHRGPVFIHQLIKDHYQMEIFGSASLAYPAFDKTVFREVKGFQIDTPGNIPAQRDQKITQEFQQFIKKRKSNRPFFSFLFYDAVHGYCETGATFPKPFQPAIGECDRIALTNDTNPLPYFNRYKNAVLYDDSLVGKVLKTLKQRHLLKKHDRYHHG